MVDFWNDPELVEMPTRKETAVADQPRDEWWENADIVGITDDKQTPFDPVKIEKTSNQAFDLSQVERIPYAEAVKKIEAGEISKEVIKSLYEIKEIEFQSTPKMTVGQTAVEYAKALGRGVLDFIKVPGILLTAYGESIPTAEEREAEIKRQFSMIGKEPPESTYVSKKLDGAALFLRRKIIEWGQNSTAYYNGIKEGVYPSREMVEIYGGSFWDHPFLRSTIGAIESAPSYGAAVAATLMTKNPNIGLAIMGTTSAASTYESLREEDIDPDMALFGSVLCGSIEVLTEKIPMEMLLKGEGKRFLIRFLKQGTAEAFQELAANMGQNYVTAVVKDVDPENLESVTRAAWQKWSVIMDGWEDAMGAGFVMGGGAAVFSGGKSADYKESSESRFDEAIKRQDPTEINAEAEVMDRLESARKMVESIVPEKTDAGGALAGETAAEGTSAGVEAEGVQGDAQTARTLTPVEGTGETVTRGLSASIEARAVEAGLVEDFGELPTYERVNKKQQAEQAVQFLNAEPDRARRVALGLEAAPFGLLPESVMKAVETRARNNGDVDTLIELANSDMATIATTMGQRISMLGEGRESSPVKAIKKVIDSRRDAQKKRGKETVTPEQTKELKARLDAAEKKLAEHQAKAVRKSNSPQQKKYGEKNKLVKKNEYDAIMERRRQAGQLPGKGKHRGGAYVPTPQDFADIAKIGMFHLEAAGRNFADWTAQMIADFGDWVEPMLEGEWQKLSDQYNNALEEALKKKLEKAAKEERTDGQTSAMAQEIADYYVRRGITDREGLIDAVWGMMKQSLPNITRRQVMDAISGYGLYSQLDNEEAKKILRDLKGQMQQLAKLEDMMKGVPPKKTGVERRTPSDMERRLIQQVEEAKKKFKIETTDKASQLKSALDEVKTRLRNQIKDLETQIKSREKIVKERTAIELDAEAKALKAQRDALREQFDAIFGDRKMSDAQKLKMATEAVKKSIAEYDRRIKQQDFTKKPKAKPITSPELDSLRQQRDALKEQYEHLKDLNTPKLTPEQIALRQQKRRMETQIKQLEERFESRQFEKTQKPPVELDEAGRKLKAELDAARDKFNAAKNATDAITPEEAAQISDLAKQVADTKAAMENSPRRESDGKPTDTELAYGTAQVLFNRYVNSLQHQKRTFSEWLSDFLQHPVLNTFEGIRDALLEVFNISRKLCATFDNSFIGRQGRQLLYKGLTGDLKSLRIWGDTFVQSNRVLLDTVRGKDVMLALEALILSDPEYKTIKKTGVALGTVEEDAPTSFPNGIPVLGIPFKASDNAYNFSSWYMRYRVAKMYLDIWRKSGKDMTDKVELESIGRLVNSMTLRGDFGSKSQTPGFINAVFFAPRMIKANFDFMTAHVFDRHMSAFAKRQAALNLLRYISAAAAILVLADFLDDDSVTWDSNSADFGKIKIGNVRFSIGGGISILMVLASRLITGSTVSSITGERKDLNTGEFGARTKKDLVFNFFENKFSPGASVIKELLEGRTWEGEPIDAKHILKNMGTPIGVRNALEAADTENAATLFAVILAEFYGGGSDVYQAKTPEKKGLWK